MINFFMGNHRWLRRKAKECVRAEEGGAKVIELGSGDGLLARKLVEDGARVTALDLAPEPSDLPPGIQWRSGDFFESIPQASGNCVIACLVLHHFEADQLGNLGKLIENSSVRSVLAAEPCRSSIARFQSYFLYPLVNSVTRHDMRVSIEAGFKRGELAEALQFDSATWSIEESTTLLGGIRFHARRRAEP